MSRREFDWALALVAGIVVFGLSLWQSLSIAHGCYGAERGLIIHPGLHLVLAYTLFASLRHGRPLPATLTGSGLALLALVPYFVGCAFSELPPSCAVAILTTAVVAGAIGMAGLVLSMLSWLGRKAWRALARHRSAEKPPVEPSPERPTGIPVVLAVLLLASLFFDSVGWGLERELFQPLQYHIMNLDQSWGWLVVFMWERALPVALGGLACWSLLRRKRWAGRVAVVYLLLTAVVAFARFGAFRFIRVDDSPPLQVDGLPGYSVFDTAVFKFAALNTVALVEAGIRTAVAGLGIVLLARSRRVRDWLRPAARPS